MKVLIINGSPNKNGCTSRALKEVENVLNKEGIETINIHIGKDDIRGCISCGYCSKNHKCAFNDIVNEAALAFEECDGLLIGSPVYYAGINGTLKSFLDRFFHSSYNKKSLKVGAAIISSRRAGSTDALDQIYKYFGISNMVIATSNYWNEVHGFNSSDVEKDIEGLQTMRTLGLNMSFLLKSIKDGKDKYGMPKYESKVFTNFIE